MQSLLEKAIAKCMVEKIPAHEVQELKQRMSPQDIVNVLPYLKNIQHPEDFFSVWKKPGSHSIDGLYMVFDFFSVLVHFGGEEAEALIRKHLDSKSPYIERVIKFAKDDRVLPDLLDKFYGSAQSETDSVSRPSKGNNKKTKYAFPIKANKIQAVRETDHTWELAGETVLLAKHQRDGKGNTLYLTVNNVYGPLADLRMFVRVQIKKARIPKPELAPGKGWQEPEKIEEIIDIDGELWNLKDKPDHNFYEETPWFCTWKYRYPVKGSLHSVELMLVDPREFDSDGKPLELYNSTVITDWEVYG